MVYSFDNKNDISKIKIQDFAFYGFEYKQKKSEVEIHCKNEMIKKEITIRFSNVICIYMQSCRFWAGGNSIQCMYVADDTYVTETSEQAKPESRAVFRIKVGSWR